jgi:hypothetical protein
MPIDMPIDVPIDVPRPVSVSPEHPKIGIPNWPTWGDHLLKLRAEHPTAHPNELAIQLDPDGSQKISGRRVKELLQNWDGLQEVA